MGLFTRAIICLMSRIIPTGGKAERRIRVISDNVHTEPSADFDECCTDFTRTDNAERFAVKVKAC